MDLKGKTAIVTGAGSGIGAAIAKTFSMFGASVVLVDLNTNQAYETAKQIQVLDGHCLVLEANTADFSKAGEIISKTIEAFGHLDILVNNAGINRDSVIWKMTEEQWDSVLDVNLKGYFNFIRAIAPVFKEQGSGKIVNISSINGIRGKFGQANYAAAKAGIIGLTKTIARELGKYNVNVNCVAPGLIETEMMKQAAPSVKEAALGEIVLGRLGQPHDIANTVAFLCSPYACHITGEVIKVDGGQYI